MNALDIPNDIRRLMALFRASIECAGAMGHTDINRVAEHVLVPLLGEVYGWRHLKNLNSPESPNFPGVDLADDWARVSIQVTSTRTSDKVKHTLEEFAANELHKKYDRCLIYILTTKQGSYSADFAPITQNIPAPFSFDSKLDILDYSDVLKEVANFPVERAEKVRDILRKNVESAPSSTLATLKQYLNYTVQSNATLDPRGMGKDLRSGALPLDEVYLSLTVERRDGRDLFRGLGRDIREAMDAPDAFAVEGMEQAETARRDEERELRRLAEPPRIETVPPARAVRENQRMIVLGDPGAGKTTLLRFLARRFAEAYRAGDERATDKEGADYGEARLPILVRIARYAEAFAKDKNLSLRDYLPKAFAESGIGETRLRTLFEGGFAAGNVLLLLDGLDEVVDPGDRAQIAAQIEHLARSIEGGRVVVSSRIAGYRNAPLGADFAEYTIRDMTPDEIGRFLERYCPAYTRALKPDAPDGEIQRDADEARKAILDALEQNPGVRRLARNPLLLTILTLIQRTRAHLPHQRVELYRIASEILLYDWQIARGIPAEKCIPENKALRLFGPMALWLHEERTSGMASEREVKERLARWWAEAYETNHDSATTEECVIEFLSNARQHTGLFVERAQGYYGFLHLTFEEYFAARQLVRFRDKLALDIAKRRHQPRWEEPILLAISYVSRDSPEDASDLIRTAIMGQGEKANRLGIRPGADEDILHRDLLLAAQCMGDCIEADKSLYQQVSDELVGLYCNQMEGRYQPLRKRLNERMAYLGRTAAGPIIISALLNALKDKDTNVRSSAAQALGESCTRSSCTLATAQLMEVVYILRTMLNAPESDGVSFFGEYRSVHDAVWEALLRIRSALPSEAITDPPADSRTVKGRKPSVPGRRLRTTRGGDRR